jgi:hypothetical protein
MIWPLFERLKFSCVRVPVSWWVIGQAQAGKFSRRFVAALASIDKRAPPLPHCTILARLLAHAVYFPICLDCAIVWNCSRLVRAKGLYWAQFPISLSVKLVTVKCSRKQKPWLVPSRLPVNPLVERPLVSSWPPKPPERAHPQLVVSRNPIVIGKLITLI